MYAAALIHSAVRLHVITWRRATLEDICTCLMLQPSNRGDALPDVKSAIRPWQALFQAPFFLSVVIEASPAIQGHHLIGFGAAVLVSQQFVDAEVASPRAYIAARILASMEQGRSVLATQKTVARANARDGVDVAVIYNAYRESILDKEANHNVRMAFVSSLVQALSGFRVLRILSETTNKPMEALCPQSPEHEIIGEFSNIGHVIYLMTEKSVRVLPGSVANPLFTPVRPVLRLRDSERELLLLSIEGATDYELAGQLAVTLPAIKARWRSIFARVVEAIPGLLEEDAGDDVRGGQKRHRVLAYVRTHMEELRPYDWRSERSVKAARAAHSCAHI